MDKPKNVIIFDFDGTIADTLETIATLYNNIAADFHCNPVSFEDKERFRSMKSQEFLAECGISIVKLPVIALRLKHEFRKEIKNIEPFEGVIAAIKSIKAAGYIIGVMSSNSVKNITAFLKENNIGDVFDFVHSGKNIFGKDKVILRLLHKHKIKRNSVVYIGDETRDIDALKRIKIPIIAVSWGFNSEEILKKQNPNLIIGNPNELLNSIQKLLPKS